VVLEEFRWRSMVALSSLWEDLLGASEGEATACLAGVIAYELGGELGHEAPAIPWH
jgi:hypothetical protein